MICLRMCGNDATSISLEDLELLIARCGVKDNRLLLEVHSISQTIEYRSYQDSAAPIRPEPN